MPPCWLHSSMLVASDGTVRVVSPDDCGDADSSGGPRGIDAAGNGGWIGDDEGGFHAVTADAGAEDLGDGWVEEGGSSYGSGTGVAGAGAVDGNAVFDDTWLIESGWADGGRGTDEALCIHAAERAHGLRRFNKEGSSAAEKHGQSGTFGTGCASETQETEDAAVLDCSLGSAALNCEVFDSWPEFNPDMCEVDAACMGGHDWMLRPVDLGLNEEAFTHDSGSYEVAPGAVWSAPAFAQWDAWAGSWPACGDGELANWWLPSDLSTVDTGSGSRDASHKGSSGGKGGNHIRRRGRVPLPHCDVPRMTNFVKPHGSEAREVTTVMIHNVPNRCRRHALVRELTALGFKGKYDFLYLPIDRRTASSVGYAFVNFPAPENAVRFMAVMNGHQFQGCKRRVAHTTAAHMQGLRENLSHYNKTCVLHSPVRAMRPLIDNTPPVLNNCEVASS
eukprot:NODE_5908_length_1722_cov_13.201254.p1 GENE.NODE_5908_length_1722_cov_13.201254~~NODE_5908_length_1722_cov_13.201254.p1  ORF type:complete len:447 (-),score=93.05 NODE_5908_length_1722_cov_13.201254:205-1545(-)